MIKITNLTKKYGDTVILDKAEYTFPQEGIVCLMGASGGGKTTLFNLIAGFDSDYEGEITVGGTSISKMSCDALCGYRRDNVGFVFQNYNLLAGYTVLENTMMGCEISKEDKKHYNKAIEVLERVGLGEKIEQKAGTLSGGQKQRVAIARALMGDPQIIFADEPTGALDRKTSTEIMELLQEISADRLVVVITHDEKICSFANEIIHISEQKIKAEQPVDRTVENGKPMVIGEPIKFNPIVRGLKNFKLHIKRYMAVSLAISIGLLAFIFSLSFGNVMEQSILEFQQKNTAFNNGYIKGEDKSGTLDLLKADSRIENTFYQYKLTDLILSLDGEKVDIPEKFPTAKATESLSYGVMPRKGKQEISLTPSIAKKFDENIKSLIGKEIVLSYDNAEYRLTISGIFNAGYDDFILSSDIEQKLYEKLSGEKNYSISYDVKAFTDIVEVSKSLAEKGLDSKNASNEVEALQNTFDKLNKLFLIISILVLAIGVFICTLLLFKLQNSRYHEVGLLSALGFGRKQISSMIMVENVLLSALATVINLVLLCCSIIVSKLLSLSFIVGGVEVISTVVATFVVVMAISGLASMKLLRTEPAEALRK